MCDSWPGDLVGGVGGGGVGNGDVRSEVLEVVDPGRGTR